MRQPLRIICAYFVFCLVSLSAVAQTGPGGVGNASGSGGQPQNRLWLRADAGTTTNGQQVSAWNDQSGNGNNAAQGTSDNQPLFIASEPLANNRPVLRFDGIDDWMQTTTHLTDNVGTLIVVGRKTALSSGYRTIFTSQDFLMLGQTPSLDQWGAYNDSGERLFTPGTSIGTDATAAFRILGYRQNGSGANQLDLFLNGTISTTLHNGGGNSKTITTIGSNSSGSSAIQHFPGDIAEVIFYGTALNEAQRLIVENYLSTKYSINIGTNDRFAYDATHGNDVAGIGQAFGGSQHLSATSNRLNISSPSSLADNRFALFGHDNGSLTLTNDNAPPSRRRLNRVWRVNVTGGSIGTVTLAFDVSGISIPSGETFRIFVDDDGDGDFSNATEYTGTLSGGIYTVTGASIPNGSYITLARTFSGSSAPVTLSYTPSTLTLVYGTAGNSVAPDVDDGGSSITSYSVSSSPSTSGISINSSGVISVAGTVNVGTYTLSVTAQNGVGSTTFNNVYTVTVQPFNVSSVVYNTTTTSVGAPVSFLPTPLVPAGSGVSFSASGLAPLTINSSTGEITGSAFTSETVYTATVTINSSTPNSTGGQVTRTLTIAALGATGPGGVGASVTNRLWLRADAGTTTNGQQVSAWNDQSGNSNNATQGTSDNRPLFIASEPLANNRPVLRFDGSDDWMQTGTHITDDVGTLMIVARKTAGFGGYLTIFTSQDFLMLGRTPSQDVWGAYNGGGERLFTPGTSIGVNSSAAFRILGYRQNGSGAGQLALFLNGTISTTLHNGGGNSKTITTIGSNSSGSSALQHFPGDIAEIIFYRAPINAAQRIIVENYLSAKYGTPTSNDRFAYDATHGNDVAGIGQASDGSQHLSATSNRLNISSPSSLADNRFALFGHDNGSLTLTSTNVPNPLNRRRLNRVWRVNVTGGSIGTVTLAFDVSGISLPTGSSISGILVDADGDFSSGATELTGTLSGGIYTVTGASIPDGSYITLARTLSTSPTAPVSLTYTPNTLTLVYGTSGSSVAPDVDDGDSPITSYSVSSSPSTSGISINSSGVISVAGTVNVGTYTLSVTAQNGVGSTTFNNVYTVTVQPFNVSSVVYNTTTTSVGAAVSFLPTPLVPAGSGVSFSATNLSPLTINPSTGEITGSAFTSETVYTATVTINSSAPNSTGGQVTRTLTIAALGATGPGGVGASVTNRLWLRADAGTTTNGQQVSAWNDQSGNGNNATQTTSANRPLFIASEPLANNRPVLRFDGSDDWMQTETHLTNNVGTLMIVARKTAAGVGAYRTIFTSQDFLMLGRTPSQDVWGAYNDGADRLYTPGTSIGTNAGAAFRILGYRQNGLGAGQLALFLDGVQSTTLHNGGGNGKGITTIGSNNAPISQNFPGDIAEVIFYRAPINAAQRIIVENYLSAKYGVSIPATSDFYAGTSPYLEQVHGIGTTDGSAKHTRAQSSGGLVLEERNSSLNATNEFLLAGHNGVDATPISTADLPSGVQQRWSRIWYLDKTGTIDARIAFDFSDANVPIIPGIAANYRLLYRAGTSGTFSEVTIVGTPFIQNTDQVAFDVDDANLQDGYYTLGTTNPTDSPLPVELISFTLMPKDKGVLIEWQTGSEVNNAGFILQRSLFREGNYTEIASYRTHDALRGLGTSPMGKRYSYFDNDRLQAGRTYFYKLLDVDFSGNLTEHPVKEITLPNEYSLSQNYPNPFNPTTTIEFSLRQDGRTTLEVFNILGQVVATLIDENLKAGAYQVRFNASVLPSGVYFYRLRSGEFVGIKKMMLLK
jgi:hypothetical protein